MRWQIAACACTAWMFFDQAGYRLMPGRAVERETWLMLLGSAVYALAALWYWRGHQWMY